MSNNLFIKTLPAKTANLVIKLQKGWSLLDNFYLSGGTALSLQTGHRESEDLDFFSKKDFDPRKVQVELEKLGQLNRVELEQNTLNTFLDGVRLQFLGYPYPLLKPTYNWKGIKLSSVIDIACTKMQTIGMRGGKKDFVDIYVLLNTFSLTKMFDAMDRKYSDVKYNKTHILKSLVYFEDADNQPMPRMHKSINWEKIKQKLRTEVKEFSP